MLWILSIATDTYIYLDCRKNFPTRRGISRAYGISALLCWAFLLVLFLMPRRNAADGIVFIMWGFFTYLTIFCAKFTFALFSLTGMLIGKIRKKPLKLGKWLGLPIACAITAILWWGALVTPHSISINRVTVASPRLPQGFNGFTIAQISDLHVGTWGRNTGFVKALVDSVNALHPDMIVFTGDIVNRETGELQPFLTTLSHLHAPCGVYSILGNHDYGDYIEWSSPEEKAANLQLLKQWERQIGWKLLNNSRSGIVAGGDTLQLIGVENWGEPPFRQYGKLIDAYPLQRDSLHHLNDHRYKILLTHNPEHWRREVIRISNIDLTLSGHTHAMQFMVKAGNWRWSPSKFRYPTWGGLYEAAEFLPASDTSRAPRYIYVNIGSGEVGLPFRVGATPEITLLTLTR